MLAVCWVFSYCMKHTSQPLQRGLPDKSRRGEQWGEATRRSVACFVGTWDVFGANQMAGSPAWLPLCHLAWAFSQPAVFFTVLAFCAPRIAAPQPPVGADNDSCTPAPPDLSPSAQTLIETRRLLPN